MEQDGGDFVVERDVPVPMRDGVRLAADLYRPATGGRPADGPFPTVLVRTTYDKRRAQEVHDAGRFAGRGYAVVLQDVRGRYGSEGDYYHGIWEVDDGHDTVEWIAAQPWSNGRVGMTGISYLAAVQCAAAVSGTRHLVALFHVKAP